MRIRTALIVGSALALVSCSDSTEPNVVTGSLSFSYTGAGAANATSFSATGTIPASIASSFGTNAWAAGSVGVGYTAIGASIPRTSTTWDLTAIQVTRTTVGTTAIDANCATTESSNCTGVLVAFGMNPNGDTSTYTCFITSGSVTISAISSTNITGSFSGSGSCFTDAGAESAFSVTGGSFNVPVTNQLL